MLISYSCIDELSSRRPSRTSRKTRLSWLSRKWISGLLMVQTSISLSWIWRFALAVFSAVPDPTGFNFLKVCVGFSTTKASCGTSG